jgi:hypothetical protein
VVNKADASSVQRDEYGLLAGTRNCRRIKQGFCYAFNGNTLVFEKVISSLALRRYSKDLCDSTSWRERSTPHHGDKSLGASLIVELRVTKTPLRPSSDACHAPQTSTRAPKFPGPI